MNLYRVVYVDTYNSRNVVLVQAYTPEAAVHKVEQSDPNYDVLAEAKRVPADEIYFVGKL